MGGLFPRSDQEGAHVRGAWAIAPRPYEVSMSNSIYLRSEAIQIS
jgi:hypothetical protein